MSSMVQIPGRDTMTTPRVTSERFLIVTRSKRSPAQKTSNKSARGQNTDNLRSDEFEYAGRDLDQR